MSLKITPIQLDTYQKVINNVDKCVYYMWITIYIMWITLVTTNKGQCQAKVKNN